MDQHDQKATLQTASTQLLVDHQVAVEDHEQLMDQLANGTHPTLHRRSET